jgi:hypothetical protein
MGTITTFNEATGKYEVRGNDNRVVAQASTFQEASTASKDYMFGKGNYSVVPQSILTGGGAYATPTGQQVRSTPSTTPATSTSTNQKVVQVKATGETNPQYIAMSTENAYKAGTITKSEYSSYVQKGIGEVQVSERAFYATKTNDPYRRMDTFSPPAYATSPVNRYTTKSEPVNQATEVTTRNVNIGVNVATKEIYTTEPLGQNFVDVSTKQGMTRFTVREVKTLPSGYDIYNLTVTDTQPLRPTFYKTDLEKKEFDTKYMPAANEILSTPYKTIAFTFAGAWVGSTDPLGTNTIMRMGNVAAGFKVLDVMLGAKMTPYSQDVAFREQQIQVATQLKSYDQMFRGNTAAIFSEVAGSGGAMAYTMIGIQAGASAAIKGLATYSQPAAKIASGSLAVGSVGLAGSQIYGEYQAGGAQAAGASLTRMALLTPLGIGSYQAGGKAMASFLAGSRQGRPITNYQYFTSKLDVTGDQAGRLPLGRASGVTVGRAGNIMSVDESFTSLRAENQVLTISSTMRNIYVSKAVSYPVRVVGTEGMKLYLEKGMTSRLGGEKVGNVQFMKPTESDINLFLSKSDLAKTLSFTKINDEFQGNELFKITGSAFTVPKKGEGFITKLKGLELEGPGTEIFASASGGKSSPRYTSEGGGGGTSAFDSVGAKNAFGDMTRLGGFPKMSYSATAAPLAELNEEFVSEAAVNVKSRGMAIFSRPALGAELSVGGAARSILGQGEKSLSSLKLSSSAMSATRAATVISDISASTTASMTATSSMSSVASLTAQMTASMSAQNILSSQLSLGMGSQGFSFVPPAGFFGGRGSSFRLSSGFDLGLEKGLFGKRKRFSKGILPDKLSILQSEVRFGSATALSMGKAFRLGGKSFFQRVPTRELAGRGRGNKKGRRFF